MSQEQPFPNPLDEAAESSRDQRWIEDNLKIFWGVAKGAFEKEGRGAIYVEADSWEERGEFTYVGPDSVPDEEIQNLIRTSNPDSQFVVIIKKPDDLTIGRRDVTSAYRVTLDAKKLAELENEDWGPL